MKFFALLVLSSTVFAQAQQAGGPPPIRFEDATAKSGIQFTHSFGSQKLGSLLESTGAGCVWFDYNNDGIPGSLCRQRQAARRWHSSLSAEAATLNSAPQSSLPEQRQTARSPTSPTRPGWQPTSTAWPRSRPIIDNDGFT